MKNIRIKEQFDIIKQDSISKFNIINFNKLLNKIQLEIQVKLYSSDGNLIRRYLIINKLFKEIYDQKLNLICIKKEKIKDYKLRGKGNLSYYIVVGLTIKKNTLYENLDYFYNIINNLSIKNNDKLIFYKKNKKYIMQFNSLNYILGIINNGLLINNKNFKFNYLLNFNNNNDKDIKKNKFYESFFFKEL